MSFVCYSYCLPMDLKNDCYSNRVHFCIFVYDTSSYGTREKHSRIFFRMGEAKESLRWLRGKNHDARKELEEFQISQSKKEEIGSISLIR